MANWRALFSLIIATTILALGACGQKDTEPPAASPTDSEAMEGNSSDHESEQNKQATALPRTPSPEGARVFFITPSDGETVSSPVNVGFGIEGMSVVAAGNNLPQSGHHHLLIDTDVPNNGLPLPADANHLHFGDASTSTMLDLAPGEYTLRLVLGDYLHIPHDPPVVSDPITLTVE